MKVRDFAATLMGRVVTVSAILVREEAPWRAAGPYSGSVEKRWRRYNRTVVGWVVGVRTVYDGASVQDHEYGNTWRPSKGHRVALVAPRPDGRTIHVPLDALTLAPDVDPLDVNKIASHWTKGAKEELRSIMADHPRDEKGRWVAATRVDPEHGG